MDTPATVTAEGATPRNRSGKRADDAAQIWRAAAHSIIVKPARRRSKSLRRQGQMGT